MDTFGYILLSVGAFGYIFILGWQFGCWMVQRDESKEVRDLCCKDDNKFHNVYYTDNKVKYTSTIKPKKKAKKTSKK